jgi:hypothetical protein
MAATDPKKSAEGGQIEAIMGTAECRGSELFATEMPQPN